MWPYNTEVKNILCETGVLLFRSGNLQLNPKIDLAKTLLEKELLISTIDALNATFDQKEKLKLAILLRDYIYKCRNLEALQTDTQKFWKDYYQFLKHYLSEYPLISIITVIVSPLYIPLNWLKLKLGIWSAKKKQIKQRENLSLSITEAAHHRPLINPLAIIPDPKLFEIPKEKQYLQLPHLSVKELSTNLAELTDISSIKFARHIAKRSSYQLKNDLKDGLQRIYYRLNGDLDSILGPLQEKIALIYKLAEGLNYCSAGFHERVNTLLESFKVAENFSELLYSVRKSLIEKTAIAQMQSANFLRDWRNEIHTYYDFTRIAHQEGLGISLTNESYRGGMSWDAIRKALQIEFEKRYTLFNLPTLLTESLRGLLIEIGYTGAREQDNPYSDSQTKKFFLLIKKFLTSNYQDTDWADFFNYDDDVIGILDINWEFIRTAFFKQLTSENYFKVCSDEDFHRHLLNLLNHIKATSNNYFTLLAQIEPKSFNLLFYRLEKRPSQALQENVIDLFFEKDETGLTPLQVIAQNNPEILTRFFSFIDSDPKLQAHIQALFIKHSNLIGESFVYASHKQAQSAFVLLNYIIQHPEIFKPDTRETCLFSEVLTEIQHGLSTLMAIKNSDITQKITLLRFLNAFPITLPQPSKKIVDFLFISLNHLEDKLLISYLINQYSALLLKNFSISYFKDQHKNIALMTEKLLNAYAAELSDRINNHVKYTTHFFNYPFGHSTSEKLKALTVIKDILNNDSNVEKIEQLHKAKCVYPALRNGRLSHLFKACTQDIAITSHIKIQLQV